MHTRAWRWIDIIIILIELFNIPYNLCINRAISSCEQFSHAAAHTLHSGVHIASNPRRLKYVF